MITKLSRWTHPIHARGIRSPDLTRLCKGKRLTDRMIDQYAREGRYGTEMQERALEKTQPRTRRNIVKEALRLLGGL